MSKPTKVEKDPSKDMAEGESALMEKIAAMPEPYRSMGERLHAIIKANGPELIPRVWYGMPAYAKNGKVIMFFRGVFAQKKERYMTIGFNEEAHLDDGNMWPTAYALIGLSEAEEAKIAALVKKACG
ncbi:MAG: hypothetical protein A4E32_01383 [Methanomassiliicoccales archaeon PtaU1.Bin124]|nr:MAG: hypothetical protein A4E32_01383 [Methanomassiliicoccales archaeon PtaU1.Bin124]